MSEDAGMPTFRCVLVGDGHTGKTTLIKRLVTGEFERKYWPTLGVSNQPLVFHTNRGPLRFDVWDYWANAGEEDFSVLHGPCHCAIIMFDFTSRVSYRNVPNWYHDLMHAWSDVPIVLCGNKADVSIKNRRLKPQTVSYHRKKNLPYFEISARLNLNLEKPFLWMARQLVGDPNLQFIPSTAFWPPDLVNVKDSNLNTEENPPDTEIAQKKDLPDEEGYL